MSQSRSMAVFAILFGFMLLVGALGVGVLYFKRSLEETLADASTTTVVVEDIEDLPDETYVPSTDDPSGESSYNPDDEDLKTPSDDPPDDSSQDLTDTESDEQTIIIKDADTTPKQYDHSFTGTVTVNAELLSKTGTPLSILSLDFTKDLQDRQMDIDKLRIRYTWDFKLGEDLDKNSFQIRVKGIIKKIYWRDLIDTYRQGTIVGQTIWDATGFDSKGWDTQTFDIESPKLRFIEIESAGVDKAVVYTTSKSFVVVWEATVKTTGGIAKKVIGQTGISLNMYYDKRSPTAFEEPSTTDPDVNNYLHTQYYDPYDNSPLLSIIVK